MANQETSTVWICDFCVHGPPSSFGGKPCAVCSPNDPMLNFYQKREKPVTTNADRIRAMTDEELAAEMSVRLSEDCLMCPVLQADCPVWESKDIECGQAMLDWLQSPAGGDGDD